MHFIYKNMKNTFLFFVFLISSGFVSKAFSQSDGFLQGELRDEAGNSIPYANVAVLKQQDSTLVTGAVTDESGKFLIDTPDPGNYVLQLSTVGFVPRTTPPFEVSDESFSKDFGVLILKEEIGQLDEVVINTTRPIITVELDRTIVRIEGTTQAAGNTAFDVISKSPGVWIDQNGGMRLNGKSGVQVMIDGRLTYLSTKDLQLMLQGISSENIKNIEIINNPSARYDAEGSAGIININLKKSVDTGLNGSVYAGYSYNGLHNYSLGGNLYYKKKSWSFYTFLDLAERASQRVGDFYRVFNRGNNDLIFDQEVEETTVTFAPSFRFGTDFEISETQSVGAVVNLSYQEVLGRLNSNSFLTSADTSDDLLIDAANSLDRTLESVTVNFHYLKEIDTLGSSFSADLDLVRIFQEEDGLYINHYDSLTTSKQDFSTILSSKNPTEYDIYSAKGDYIKKYNNGRKIELGAKVSRVTSDNSLQFFIHDQEEQLLDRSRSNHFVYEENIYAMYMNFAAKLGSKLHLQGGLRVEQTDAEGLSITLEEEMSRSYFDLFPSIFLQHDLSDDYQVNYSYSRRIQRPNYVLLNPFRFYVDPLTWAQGNPLLKPMYTDAFSVTQSFRKMSLALNYSYTEDFIAEIPVQNTADKTTIFYWENVDDSQNLSATFTSPLRIMKNWQTSNQATVGWQYFSMVLNNERAKNEELFYTLQSTHNISLPNDYRLEINAAYMGPQAWGLYKAEPQWWLDLGVRKSFLQEKLDLTLNINDIFHSRWMRINSNREGNVNQIEQYQSSQSIGLNLRYNFSKGEKTDFNEDEERIDELERTGGN